jgi:NAD(P)H-hydrate repair Nnr-like enzyme with NAD(P)H-hydrate dehydratase domain
VLHAVVWAVHVHGIAGELAAGRGHGIGTLAREIADELPSAMRALDGW